jgi:hypothetical protein
MIKKTLFILVGFFLFQLLFSCIFCHCNDPETYDINYNSVEVTSYNTAGFTDEVVADSVYKNAFGLGIYMISDLVLSHENSSFAVLGFSSIKACSCVDDTYVYIDPISHVTILVTDTETEIITDVTSLFGMPVDDNEYVSLEQFFRERADWHDGFQFELVDFEMIPNSAIFTVQAYLESGTMFSEVTQQINFKN